MLPGWRRTRIETSAKVLISTVVCQKTCPNGKVRRKEKISKIEPAHNLFHAADLRFRKGAKKTYSSQLVR
jgi:hypothetical protein